MYCSNCGTPLTQGLSFCNRCGVNLKERPETNTKSVFALLMAIVVIAVAGLGIMLGGSLALRNEAGLSQQLIGVFMLFVFLIVSTTEIMLVRNLSKLTGRKEEPRYLPAPPVTSHDLRLPQATPLGEPVRSVTENTTRTLEYVQRQQ
jgi:hypothetical protein